MGLMNKIKGILFDEDEIEVNVDSDELPERVPKDVKRGDKHQVGGFIDHNSDSEEDTIKEIIIPKDDDIDDFKATRDKINEKSEVFDVFEDDFDKRVINNISDDFMDNTEENYFGNELVKEKEIMEDTQEFREIPRRTTEDIRREYNIASPVKKHTDEIKDYKKMVQSKESESSKKPFTVTPVISPVYGILDKNYKADEVLEKRELINKTNSGVKPRMFGPVSYNDQPLPVSKPKGNNLKKDLVELNETINELITDSITSEDIKPVVKEIPKEAFKEVPKVKEKRKIIIEEVTNEPEIEEENDEIIQTENYDDYETTSIENEYLGNNDIEDAFEPTGELNTINERDQELKESDQEFLEVDFNTVVSKPDEEDDQELDNTIETDLFNLIDSMYKSDDKDEEEE